MISQIIRPLLAFMGMSMTAIVLGAQAVLDDEVGWEQIAAGGVIATASVIIYRLVFKLMSEVKENAASDREMWQAERKAWAEQKAIDELAWEKAQEALIARHEKEVTRLVNEIKFWTEQNKDLRQQLPGRDT